MTHSKPQMPCSTPPTQLVSTSLEVRGCLLAVCLTWSRVCGQGHDMDVGHVVHVGNKGRWAQRYYFETASDADGHLAQATHVAQPQLKSVRRIPTSAAASHVEQQKIAVGLLVDRVDRHTLLQVLVMPLHHFCMFTIHASVHGITLLESLCLVSTAPPLSLRAQ